MEKLNSYLGMAENDLLFARQCMEAGYSIGNFNVVASLCAQAGEKYLKAVIERDFLEDSDVLNLLHSHNLRALHNRIIKKHSLSVDSKDCKWLGDFYYDARYPGDNFVEVDADDAEECLRIVTLLAQDTAKILESCEREALRAKKDLMKLKAF